MYLEQQQKRFAKSCSSLVHSDAPLRFPAVCKQIRKCQIRPPPTKIWHDGDQINCRDGPSRCFEGFKKEDFNRDRVKILIELLKIVAEREM